MQDPIKVNQVLWPLEGEPLKVAILYGGKLKIQMSKYSNQEEFLIGNIHAANVIWGMPWHHMDS